MPASKTAIGLLALQTLRAVDGDASADSNDTTIIEAAYDSIWAMLNEKHLVSWASDGSVPDEFINPVVMLVAESRLTLFTPPANVEAAIIQKASTAVEDITEMLMLDYVPTEIPSEPL